MSKENSLLLFSYGTLQIESVQRASFGRLLNGEQDVMPGYRKEMLEITDPAVIEKSGERFHPVIMPSENLSDEIEGTVYEVSEGELRAADRYEVSDYKRILVSLKSGRRAWVYIKA